MKTESRSQGTPEPPARPGGEPPELAAAPDQPRASAGGELRPQDEAWMALALAEARVAAAEDEVPVGAVLVRAGAGDAPEVLARAHNRTRADCDPTAHAEILAVRAAALAAGHQRLLGCTLYTTVEPCFMCAGALVHARVERVVWAVRDPKFGGSASLGRVLDHPRLNHKVAWAEGAGADEARALLQEFFRSKR